MKHNPNPHYLTAASEFVRRVGEDLQRVTKGEVVTSMETGRKFDRLRTGFLTKGGNTMVSSVRYFINKETGEIYGAKSQVAPNPNHFYGTIYTAHQWDWSGDRAKPYDETQAGVRAVSSYDKYVHYEKVG